MAESYIEPILYHSEVNGWHHHHSEAGALVHLDEAPGHATDLDGTTVVYSAHLADHDEIDIDEPCLDDKCDLAVYPEHDEWIVRDPATEEE